MHSSKPSVDALPKTPLPSQQRSTRHPIRGLPSRLRYGALTTMLVRASKIATAPSTSVGMRFQPSICAASG
jgi:hypothetical protein